MRGTLSRRQQLMSQVASSLLLFASPTQRPASASISAVGETPANLLKMIPIMPFGAPATRATLDVATAEKIEAEAMALERRGAARNLATDPKLSGTWLLRCNTPHLPTRNQASYQHAHHTLGVSGHRDRLLARLLSAVCAQIPTRVKSPT